MAKKRPQTNLTRRKRNLAIKTPIFVACEGKTEIAYLKALIANRYLDQFTLRSVVQPSKQGKRTDLGSLVDQLEHFEIRCQESGFKKGHTNLWLVCDADPMSNERHTTALTNWLRHDNHRTAISDNSIEGWFLTHFTNARPSSPSEALNKLQHHCPNFKKGGPIPIAIIESTDTACARERQYWTTCDQTETQVWPARGASQMPLLISFIDDLMAKQSGVKP